MTTATAGPAGYRTGAGVGCAMAGMMLFAAQDAAMKALLGDVTIWMMICARSVVSVLILAPLILFLGPPHRLLSPLWPWLLARGALFGFGFSLFYTAFPFMGLAEVTTIFFAAPLLTALIAALFLGEPVGPHRAKCLVVGFLGVLLAMRPGGGTFQWVAVLPLITATTYAVGQVIARRIGDRETSLTLGLYTIAFGGAVVAPSAWALNAVVELGPEFRHLRWDWSVAPDDAGIVALVAVVGMVGYVLISRAYQIAEASVVAPFDYAYLPIAALMAFAFWGEVPGSGTLAGMALIVGSGLYLGYRELRRPEPVLEPAPTAEIAFTPGAPIGAIAHAADARGEDGAAEIGEGALAGSRP
jgi:drug/metabolite transporter (DMT)-like permease